MSATYKRNKAARDFRAFEQHIASPFAVSSGTSFVMPANGRIGVSLNNPTTSGQLRLTIGSRTLSFGALGQLQVARSDWVEKGKAINFQSDVIGIARLYIYDDWMRPHPIASRTF